MKNYFLPFCHISFCPQRLFNSTYVLIYLDVNMYRNPHGPRCTMTKVPSFGGIYEAAWLSSWWDDDVGWDCHDKTRGKTLWEVDLG